MADGDTDAVQIQDAPPAPMLGVRPPLILRGDPNQPRMQPLTPEQSEKAANDLYIAKLQARLPYDQAQKAVVAAIKFQAQRGFQSDLAAGKSAGETLAKWAPALFYDRPQTFAGAVTRAFSPPAAAPTWVPANQVTGEPGHFVTRVGGVNVPRAGREGELTQVERDDLRFAEREVDKLQSRQDQDVQGRSAANAPDPAKLTVGQRARAQDFTRRQQQIQQYQDKIDSYHSQVSRAVKSSVETVSTERETEPSSPAATAETGMTRGVRLPSELRMPVSTPSDSKVQRAKALRRDHPDWSKQQIIDAVNRGG